MGCFHLEIGMYEFAAMVNHATVYIHVQVFGWTYVVIYLEVELLGHITLRLTFEEPPGCLRKWLRIRQFYNSV